MRCESVLCQSGHPCGRVILLYHRSLNCIELCHQEMARMPRLVAAVGKWLPIEDVCVKIGYGGIMSAHFMDWLRGLLVAPAAAW